MIKSFETDSNSEIIKHLSQPQEPASTQKAKKHWTKYPSFIFFFLSNFYSFLFYNVFAPATNALVSIYEVTTVEVMFTATSFLVGTFCSAFLVLYLSKYFKIQTMVKVGCLLNILGSGVWVLIRFDFYFLYLGQFLMGLSICCFLGNHLEICSNWFKPATSQILSFLLTLVVMLAIGLSDSLILLFFQDFEITLDNMGQENFENFVLISTISVFIVNFLCCVFFRENPPIR